MWSLFSWIFRQCGILDRMDEWVTRLGLILVPAIFSTFIPWMFSRKIAQDTEGLIEKNVDKALKTRPTEERVRDLLKEEIRDQEKLAADRFATKEAFARFEARIETKIDSLASKESVASLSTQVDSMVKIMERLDGKMDIVIRRARDTRP